MKKYTLVLFVLIIPTIAFASWWNPTTWKIFNKKSQASIASPSTQNDEIQKLKQQIETLQKQQQNTSTPNSKTSAVNKNGVAVSNPTIQPSSVGSTAITQVSQNPIPKPSSTLEPAHVLSFNSTYTSTVNYNNFNKINGSSYAKNSGVYFVKQIKITFLSVNKFISSSNGGYINVTTPEEVMLEINNINDYQEVLNSLSEGDNITIYGIGMTNTNINQVNSYRTATLNYPVISIQRIDKCNSGCSTIYSKTIPQDQGIKAGSYQKISLHDALRDAAIYTSTNFTTQVTIRDFLPYDNIGNYAVGIIDPNDQDSLATVIVDSNSKNQLQIGSLIEVSGQFKYIGALHLNIDTLGSPVKIIRY